MFLDDSDLRRGLEFIVGNWQVDYLVNAFSNDLAHIPATEFKSDDGTDFTSLKFSFYEDHTVIMTDTSRGREERGTWEQTGLLDYHYTLGAFLDLPEGDLRKSAETLSVQDGRLVFGLGFLAVALQKTADGAVTKEPDVGEKEGDPALTEIVGRYAVAKIVTMIGEEFGMFSREEVEDDLARRVAAGEIDEDEAREGLSPFETFVDFTDDHRVVSWMKLPDGVSDEEIRAAQEEGQIGEVKDGYFAETAAKEWKAVDGRYYYNTGETRELFGEAQSPWDELKTDEEGLLDYSGVFKLRRI